MNKFKNITIIIMSIVILILLFLVQTKQTKVVYKEKKLISVDTVYKDSILQGKKIFIKSDAIIEYKTLSIRDTTIDTLIQTKPFTATLDTLNNKDTISIKYEFPENKFYFVLKSSNDILKIPEIRINTETEPEKSFYRKYIEIPLYCIVFIGGAYAGSKIK